MNPVFIIFLFAISLVAIVAACVLLFYIGKELRLARIAKSETEDVVPESPATKEVSDFLSKMQAATLIGAASPQKTTDDQDDK